jgi:hypothetical protein
MYPLKKRFGVAMTCATLGLSLGLMFVQAAPAAMLPDSKTALTSKSPKLTWAPPALTAPITINVTESNRDLKLDLNKDYIIKMPATPLKVMGGLIIFGGRNVVLIGGVIEAPDGQRKDLSHRGLYLHGQTGTLHVEGLLIRGDKLEEGINIDQRSGAVLQLQNLRIEKVHGSFSGHHADLLQTWAGPAELRIDRLTGTTDYQGFFLLPNQHFKGDVPKGFDFRRINIIGTETSAYMLWGPSRSSYPVKIEDVWVRPNPRTKKFTERDAFLWPKPATGDTTWQAVQAGTPPGGDFVPAGVAGLGYVSPGYAPAPAKAAAVNATGTR